MDAKYTHVAFADESNWIKGRFRSISLISARADHARAFHKELDALRKKHKKSEFKWKKTCKRHGIALADFFFERHDKMRADVLVWDTEDSRHLGLSRRDDKENFARMYYHLLHNVLKRRWPHGSRWLICPDEQKEVDWLKLEECLAWKRWASEESLFARTGATTDRHVFYNIHDCRCVSSEKYPLVQLADMFAGLAAYSYTEFCKYQQWKSDQDPTLPLFPGESLGVKSIPLSNSDDERLPILQHIHQGAGQRTFQLSLDSSKGLCSKNPKNPLNFWLYTPQRASDKAPVKNGG